MRELKFSKFNHEGCYGRTLDIGLGSGNSTRRLIELPAVTEVVAIDKNHAPVDRISKKLPQGGKPIEIQVANILDFKTYIPFDCIYSNACFHLIGKHEELFRNLFRLVKVGGSLFISQAGYDVMGQLHDILQHIESYPEFECVLSDGVYPAFYPTFDTIATLLSHTGFSEFDYEISRQDVDVSYIKEEFIYNINSVASTRLPHDISNRLTDELAIAVNAATVFPYYETIRWTAVKKPLNL